MILITIAVELVINLAIWVMKKPAQQHRLPDLLGQVLTRQDAFLTHSILISK